MGGYFRVQGGDILNSRPFPFFGNGKWYVFRNFADLIDRGFGVELRSQLPLDGFAQQGGAQLSRQFLLQLLKS